MPKIPQQTHPSHDQLLQLWQVEQQKAQPGQAFGRHRQHKYLQLRAVEAQQGNSEFDQQQQRNKGRGVEQQMREGIAEQRKKHGKTIRSNGR